MDRPADGTVGASLVYLCVSLCLSVSVCVSLADGSVCASLVYLSLSLSMGTLGAGDRPIEGVAAMEEEEDVVPTIGCGTCFVWGLGFMV